MLTYVFIEEFYVQIGVVVSEISTKRENLSTTTEVAGREIVFRAVKSGLPLQ